MHALIGLMTTTSTQSTINRQYLRASYATRNKQIKTPSHRFEFKFVYGSGRNTHELESRAFERVLFPGDTVVLDIPENMDDGKTFHWFAQSREWLYTQHPEDHTAYCARFNFVGKGDDDTILHVPRLSKFFETVSTTQLNYIGTYFWKGYMTGLLYFLSTPLVEYITVADQAWSSAHKVGFEDEVTAKLIEHTELKVNNIQSVKKMHDHYDSDKWDAGFTTYETMALHWNHDIHHLVKGFRDLYGSDGVDTEEAIMRFIKDKGYNLDPNVLESILKEFRDAYDRITIGDVGWLDNQLRQKMNKNKK
ncbi:hypothetical protein HDU98_006730 [Podochytrium sp. JEL0797]|nr:hypothetical protein HDU98_006730 [Podochytrium sp. JEL0797]